MADFNKPTIQTPYVDVLDELKDSIKAVATKNFTGSQNIPFGTVRKNGAYQEVWNGFFWSVQDTSFRVKAVNPAFVCTSSTNPADTNIADLEIFLPNEPKLIKFEYLLFLGRTGGPTSVEFSVDCGSANAISGTYYFLDDALQSPSGFDILRSQQTISKGFVGSSLLKIEGVTSQPLNSLKLSMRTPPPDDAARIEAGSCLSYHLI